MNAGVSAPITIILIVVESNVERHDESPKRLRGKVRKAGYRASANYRMKGNIHERDDEKERMNVAMKRKE